MSWNDKIGDTPEERAERNTSSMGRRSGETNAEADWRLRNQMGDDEQDDRGRPVSDPFGGIRELFSAKNRRFVAGKTGKTIQWIGGILMVLSAIFLFTGFDTVKWLGSTSPAPVFTLGLLVFIVGYFPRGVKYCLWAYAIYIVVQLLRGNIVESNILNQSLLAVGLFFVGYLVGRISHKERKNAYENEKKQRSTMRNYKTRLFFLLCSCSLIYNLNAQNLANAASSIVGGQTYLQNSTVTFVTQGGILFSPLSNQNYVVISFNFSVNNAGSGTEELRLIKSDVMRIYSKQLNQFGIATIKNSSMEVAWEPGGSGALNTRYDLKDAINLVDISNRIIGGKTDYAAAFAIFQRTGSITQLPASNPDNAVFSFDFKVNGGSSGAEEIRLMKNASVIRIYSKVLNQFGTATINGNFLDVVWESGGLQALKTRYNLN